MLLFVPILLLGFTLAGPGQVPAPFPAAPAWATLPPEKAARVVFLGGELAEEDLIAFSANLSASGHPGTFLLDAPKFSPYFKTFLAAFQPEQVVAVGPFPDGIGDLEKRLGIPVGSCPEWIGSMPLELGKHLFPRAERIVVTPAAPRRQLLLAAQLAGAMHSPLIVYHGKKGEEADLRRWANDWHTEELYLVGNLQAHVPGVRSIRLADEEALTASCLRHTASGAAVHSLVVANPADTSKKTGTMSCLAPWIASQRRAPLLLTNDAGDNTASIVEQAMKHPKLRSADALVLAADLKAIPMEQRANPLEGKDSYIEMEPLTPTGTDAFTFATGRLFHADPGVVTLMLARQRLLAAKEKPRALVASNPTGSLPLLEMFSRNTARELSNSGFDTKTLFGREISREVLRKEMPNFDVFLWEGHHSTLVKDYEMPSWTEPLPPSFMFLQSCLALAEWKAQPLLERGAVAVVGSSTRTYSATGGGFSLAYFNALLYDGESFGGSLRQAKNFLLAYTLLKEKRLGTAMKLNGANLRSAWAFTLWGDPDGHLPTPSALSDALAAVRHEVHGHTLTVKLPDTTYEKTISGKYQAEMRPNARLAGLIHAVDDDDRRLVPFLFVEVLLPKAPANKTPHLHSKLPESHHVFVWDARRRCGYLLVTPRPHDQRELRFHIEWEEPTVEAQANP